MSICMLWLNLLRVVKYKKVPPIYGPSGVGGGVLRTTKVQVSLRYLLIGKYHIKTFHVRNFTFLASLCS